MRRYDSSGRLVLETKLQGLERIGPDGEGGLWIAAGKTLSRIDSSGRALVQVEPLQGSLIADLAPDPANSTVWVANEKGARYVGGDGQLRQVADVSSLNGRLWVLALESEAPAPTLRFSQPVEGSAINSSRPAIQLTYTGYGSAMDQSSLALAYNGNPLPVSCSYRDLGADCVPTVSFPEGASPSPPPSRILPARPHPNTAGKTSPTAQVTFTVDTLPPVITVDSPQDGLLT